MRCSEPERERTGGWQTFALAVLEKAGVGAVPRVDFGQAGKRLVRFSYAASGENAREAARRLEEYLGQK